MYSAVRMGPYGPDASMARAGSLALSVEGSGRADRDPVVDCEPQRNGGLWIAASAAAGDPVACELGPAGRGAAPPAAAQ